MASVTTKRLKVINPTPTVRNPRPGAVGAVIARRTSRPLQGHVAKCSWHITRKRKAAEEARRSVQSGRRRVRGRPRCLHAVILRRHRKKRLVVGGYRSRGRSAKLLSMRQTGWPAKLRSGRRPGDVPEGTAFCSWTKSFTRRSRELQTWRGPMLTNATSSSLAEALAATTVAEDFELDPWNYFLDRRAPLTLEIGSERANRSLPRLLLIPIVIILRWRCGPWDVGQRQPASTIFAVFSTGCCPSPSFLFSGCKPR